MYDMKIRLLILLEIHWLTNKLCILIMLWNKDWQYSNLVVIQLISNVIESHNIYQDNVISNNSKLIVNIKDAIYVKINKENNISNSVIFYLVSMIEVSLILMK
jgi:hypothetical protein